MSAANIKPGEIAQLRWAIVQSLEACGSIGAFLEVILVPVRSVHPEVTIDDLARELEFLRAAGVVATDHGGGRLAAMLTEAGCSFAAYESEAIEGIARPSTSGEGA